MKDPPAPHPSDARGGTLQEGHSVIHVRPLSPGGTGASRVGRPGGDMCTAGRFVHRSTWRSAPRVVHRVWRDGPGPHVADLRLRALWGGWDDVRSRVTTPM